MKCHTILSRSQYKIEFWQYFSYDNHCELFFTYFHYLNQIPMVSGSIPGCELFLRIFIV
jgi:hypothetical protein